MPYFPVARSSDDRSKKSLVPVRLRNVMVTPLAEGSRRGGEFAVVPRPGLVARARPKAGENIRGLISQPGFHNDVLYAVVGDALYAVDTLWSSASKGTVSGTDPVVFGVLTDSLGICADESIIEWDGSALTTVTDEHAPDPAGGICVFGTRLVGFQKNTDINSWSAVGDMQDWPALAFGSSEARADPVVNNVVAGSVMVSFGAVTTQVFYATGGSDEEAITQDTTYRREIGLLTRDAVNVIDEIVLFIGTDLDGNRVPVIMTGLVPRRLINYGLIDRLRKLTAAQIAELRTLVIGWGEKKLWLVRMPDDGPTLAYDIATDSWTEWTSFGEDRFSLGFSASFNGKIVGASPDGDAIYSLEDDVYEDDGEPIERVVTFHVPVQGPVQIDNVTLDIKCHDQPLQDDNGDAFVPKATIRYYFDGGTLDSVTEWADERVIDLPAAGDYGIPAPEHRFGLARAPNGILVEVTITDPIGFAIYGLWVNEMPE